MPVATGLNHISEKHLKRISIVIPVYNEQDSIMPLAKKLHTVLESLPHDYEIIFVDDGSVDQTYEELQLAQIQVQNLTILRLKKNFGQTHAFSAGFSYATGDYIISMDGDLQNDPRDIPQLLQVIENRYDVVSGWRKNRRDSASKRFISKGFNIIRYFLIGDPIHDGGCSLKIFRAAAIKSLLPLPSKTHGCLTSMLYLRGFEVGEMIVTHYPRTRGKTKYRNPFRILHIFWMLLYVRFWWRYTHPTKGNNVTNCFLIREIVKP